MIKKTLFPAFFIMLFFFSSSFRQDNKALNEKKILVIIDNKTQKLWTQTEYQDSINWSKVKLVTIIPDTTAIKKYGKKGENGAFVVQYK